MNTSPPGRNCPSPLGTGTKAGIGIGAVVGALAMAGILFHIMRNVQRRRRDNTRHSGALGAIETAPLESRQWEKPELVGEDARKEMEAGERTGAELPGEEARMDMGAADLRQMIIHELHG